MSDKVCPKAKGEGPICFLNWLLEALEPPATGRVGAPVGETRAGIEKLKPWRNLMNGMPLLFIDLIAPALLGLHAGAES